MCHPESETTAPPGMATAASGALDVSESATCCGLGPGAGLTPLSSGVPPKCAETHKLDVDR